VTDPQEPPQQGSSKLIYVFLGCVGCLGVMALGVALLIGAGIFGVTAIMKAAEPAKADARKFLSEAAAGDVDAAHAHFSEALKKKKPKEALKADVEQSPDLFNAADSTFNHVSIVNGITSIKGSVTSKGGKVYSALFRYADEGKKPVMVEFILRDGPIADDE
jgi:hypothetical protein